MDTKQLFEAALGLKAPWQITGIDFDQEAEKGRGRLEIRIDFALSPVLSARSFAARTTHASRAGGTWTSSSTRRT